MGGPVNLPAWVLSIPASLALHAVPIVLLVKLLTPSVQDVFVIDLSERLEVAQVGPQPTESVRRPSGPPASPTRSAPSPPRREAPTNERVGQWERDRLTPRNGPPCARLGTHAGSMQEGRWSSW